MPGRNPARLHAAVLLVAVGTGARAVDWRPDAVSIEGGSGEHRTWVASVGLTWDWHLESLRDKPALSAHTELLVNHWRADDMSGGSQSLTQLAVLPSLRMRLKHGVSPWYLEAGIGVSWLDKPYLTPTRTFSTQWNFIDMLGVGCTLGGPHGHREMGLRLTHTSNAGLKKPNPGQDFLQLRLVQRF
jgi:lipid A 3-O-deacylase